METAPALTRIDVMAAAVRRLRQHYGQRLMALYALPGDPYEQEENTVESIHLLVVLKPPTNVFEENEAVAHLLDRVIREFEAAYLVYAHLSEPGEDLARYAQEEGVRL